MNQLTMPTTQGDEAPVLDQVEVRQREHEPQERRQSPAAPVVDVADRDRVQPLEVGTGELRRPLREECCDPLREVVGLRHLGLRDRLELELLGEGRLLRGVEQALRVPDGARRHRGEELGDLVRAVLELVGRHDLRDEAPRPRLLRAETAAGRQPLERAGGAEQAAHEPRAAGVRDEADVDERRHEARAVGGDAHVARERQGHAGARGGAVDGRDHGLLERPDREHVAVVVLPQILGHVARTARELLQVLADAEAATGAGDHHRAYRRILGVTQCGLDPTMHRTVQRVQHVGPIERDRQDRSRARDLDVCHRARP